MWNGLPPIRVGLEWMPGEHRLHKLYKDILDKRKTFNKLPSISKLLCFQKLLMRTIIFYTKLKFPFSLVIGLK